MHFPQPSFNLIAMTKPLALVFYEKPLPGQQLANRLQDLGYKVQVLTNAANLAGQVAEKLPMLLVTEFSGTNPNVGAALSSIKQNPDTSHVAVLVYIPGATPALQQAARAAGANLTVSERGVLDQLPELLDQVLSID